MQLGWDVGSMHVEAIRVNWEIFRQNTILMGVEEGLVTRWPYLGWEGLAIAVEYDKTV